MYDKGDQCPDDDALFSLAMGELDSHTRTDIEEHVRACDICRDGLTEALHFLAPEGLELEEQSTSFEDLPRLDRYELREVIGSGGAGIVYLAFDPTLRREVAIKLLRPATAAAPLIQRRLLREARAMAKLSHPNVVTAHDVGESEAGVFIVLEYHPGGSLDAWLKEEHPLETRLDLVLQAGRGLIAAHEQGIVHRDFKPQNVLIGSHGRACVTDFGLATFDTPASGSRFQLDNSVGEATITRGIMGTPSYMAPEVLAGDPADQLADQFSFCVTAYLALNGRHPFGISPNANLAELLARIRGGLLAASDPTLPGHVASALARGLSADPKHRFASMSELLGALQPRPARFGAPLFKAGAAASALIALGAALWLGFGSTDVTQAPEPPQVGNSPVRESPPPSNVSPAGAEHEPTSDSNAPLRLPPEPAKSAQEATKKQKPQAAPAPAKRSTKPATAPGRSQEKLDDPEKRYDDWLRDPFH